MADVFPPALVPVLRDRFGSRVGCIAEVADSVLVQLLTTVFFAGLETYEGERNPIRVVFVGAGAVETVVSERPESGAVPVYRWKLLRFASARPFVVPELVKLAVAGSGDRIYSAVQVIDDERLVIVGLAREGLNAYGDRFVKVATASPGCLSIHSGRERLLDYERGAILAGAGDVVLSAKPVRSALEAAARADGLDDDDLLDYLDCVRALVREMTAHGRGGILIICPEEWPRVPDPATYKVVLDSSLAALLRLARRIGRSEDGTGDEGERVQGVSFRHVLRNAFVTEAERVIEELGALTAIDGATLLNRGLALVAFGVILPVGRQSTVAEASDSEGSKPRTLDLGARGTRHRAGATYADDHPGSVVFVASEDGKVTCMFRDPSRQEVLLWHVGRAEVHPA